MKAGIKQQCEIISSDNIMSFMQKKVTITKILSEKIVSYLEYHERSDTFNPIKGVLLTYKGELIECITVVNGKIFVFTEDGFEREIRTSSKIKIYKEI
jgi:hypothetical protein